jgi:hypothetical protein
MLMSRGHKAWMILFVTLLSLIPVYAMAYTTGRVVDFFTGKPVKGALVTLNNDVVLTDKNGIFTVSTALSKLSVRAPGYGKTEQIPIPLNSTPQDIKLIPFTPKALYLSFFGIGNRNLRESAIKLTQETELNTLVIDVKGDRGMIPYKSSIPLAAEVGAQRTITVKEVAHLMRSLKAKGIYTIARIVVFKDNLLALARPEWAVKTPGGEIWRDRENLAWVDPFNKEVWDYNISIALEAAQYGFDEIQFDYIRFPEPSGLRFSMPPTEENRVNAVSGFLMEARRRLIPYNIFLSADIFGYVCWNLNDTKIGQRLEDLVTHLDYICPMLYPSGFQYGIPGYRNPVANPYEIIYLSLKRAQERTNLPSHRFRPWLQAFRDYAFDGRYFNDKEIMGEVKAAEGFGSHGWMLWNPRNTYSSAGLKKEKPLG